MRPNDAQEARPHRALSGQQADNDGAGLSSHHRGVVEITDPPGVTG
jgi:hypothetical protein